MGKIYMENGRLCTRIYLGVNESGKKQFKKIRADTERELNKLVFDFRKTLDSGIDIHTYNDSLEKWINEYLDSIEMEVNCGCYSESEYNTQKARLEYFINYNNGILAKAKLKDILTSHIQPCVFELYKKNPSTGKNTAKRTLQRYVAALSNVFEYARKQRAYNYANPCDDIKIPKQAIQQKRVALTKTAIKLVLTTEHRAKLTANIMMLAGLRRGEITALTWNDIDFENHIIDVSKSYDFKACRIKAPKTQAGMRKIIINDTLYDLLKEAYENRTSDYLVEKVYGGRMTESAWKRMFESYMVSLEEKGNEYDRKHHTRREDCFVPFTSHQLRHTYCSMLQWSGVDMKTAQDLMGHSEIDVTANTYTHVDLDTKIHAAALQSDYLKKYFTV